jgi:RNA polymerase sigma factor (sigma-70 family)
MKCYNIQNYIRYKKDIKQWGKRVDWCRPWDEMTRDELIVKFMPLAENLARKFSTTQQASGVMTINDLIQEGNKNLVIAVDKIVWDTIYEADDPEQRLKSFLSKRIKGGIRRAIDIMRGTMRIPEHKINEIRKNEGKDRDAVEMFFNSVFQSLDAMVDDASNMYDVPEPVQTYNPELLASYLIGLLQIHLDPREFDVIVYSYGINCDKLSAKQIAAKLDIKGDSAYVRVSQLKRQAINKLIDNVDYSQVVDFL